LELPSEDLRFIGILLPPQVPSEILLLLGQVDQGHAGKPLGDGGKWGVAWPSLPAFSADSW